MRAKVAAKGTRGGAQLRLSELQRQLILEALMFHMERPGGDRASTVRLGVGRASVARIIEKIRGASDEFDLPEIHVLFTALISASFWIPSEEAFYERMGFFRERALALADGLMCAIQELPGTDEGPAEGA